MTADKRIIYNQSKDIKLHWEVYNERFYKNIREANFIKIELIQSKH